MQLVNGICQRATILGLIASLSVAPAAWAKRGGGGKPGGDGGNACASLGSDPNEEGRITTSRNWDSAAGQPEYSFVLETEIENPDPEDSALFGNSIDTWRGVIPGDTDPSTYLAVAAPQSLRVYIYTLAAGGANLVASISLPPEIPDSQSLLQAYLEDVDGDAHPDLIVTSGAVEKGWIYPGPGYSTYTTLEPQVPDLATDVHSAQSFGWRSLVFDSMNSQLYIGAPGADAGGTRGAIFRCDLTGGPEPNESCGAQALPPEAYDALGKFMTLGDLLSGPAAPELLVAANGTGKGKNRSPDRVFVYVLGAGPLGVPYQITGTSGKLAAVEYTGASPTVDELIITEFHSPGWVLVDPQPELNPAAETTGTKLPVDPNLVFQYGNNIDTSPLASGLSVVVVGGAGAAESCNGGQGENDGFAYLYVFGGPDQGTAGVMPVLTETVQAPNSLGRDFGWDVAATGSELVVIGERRGDVVDSSTGETVAGAGKVYVYRYIGPQFQ